MNKTKIDWCDSTWNPVTGCLHNCEYCYARRIAERFKQPCKGYLKAINTQYGNIFEFNEPAILVNGLRKSPYPCGFQPTFHKYHLNDYIGKKGRNIFVCSMADLFGKWVPDKWIEEVFKACENAPQHNYIFLTKNPKGIPKTSHLYNGVFGDHGDNFWFGTTITCQGDLEERLWTLLQVRGHTFLSIEPLHEELNLGQIWVKEKDDSVLLSLPNKMAYYLNGGESYHMPEWVIIGSETGRRKNKVIPQKEWVKHIVNMCREANIPVFMKSSLADIWGEPLIQEFPEALGRDRRGSGE